MSQLILYQYVWNYSDSIHFFLIYVNFYNQALAILPPTIGLFCVKKRRRREVECRNPRMIWPGLVFGDNAHVTAYFLYIFSYHSSSNYADLRKL